MQQPEKVDRCTKRNMPPLHVAALIALQIWCNLIVGCLIWFKQMVKENWVTRKLADCLAEGIKVQDGKVKIVQCHTTASCALDIHQGQLLRIASIGNTRQAIRLDVRAYPEGAYPARLNLRTSEAGRKSVMENITTVPASVCAVQKLFHGWICALTKLSTLTADQIRGTTLSEFWSQYIAAVLYQAVPLTLPSDRSAVFRS